LLNITKQIPGITYQTSSLDAKNSLQQNFHKHDHSLDILWLKTHFNKTFQIYEAIIKKKNLTGQK